MKKKTLGRITALGLAALTAVPAFSIVASADVVNTVPNAYRVMTGVNANGTIAYEYYTTPAAANTRKDQITLADGNPPTVTQVTSIPGVNWGATIYYDANGKIYTTDPGGGATTAKWGGTTDSNMGANNSPITSLSTYYKYADQNYVYQSSVTQTYYPNLQALQQCEPTLGSSYARIELSSVNHWSTTNRYFDYNTGNYVSNPIGSIIEISGTTAGSTGYSSNYYTSTYRYYSSYTGLFYTSSEDARLASNGYSSYVTDYYTNSSSTRSSSYPYYSRYTGRYYATREAAIIASGDNSSYVDGTGSYTVYYSPYTGRYYDTLSAANAATPTGYTVRTITNSAYTASYLNTYGYSYGYYNGYYNGYYDPNYYYYYYLMGNNGLTGSTTTTTNTDTSTVTIGKYTGWTNVIKVINSARVGASYAVNMKSETEIPEKVLTAMKGKNINILFTYSNGSVITINGNDITSTTAFSPTVRYGSTSIPSSLKKKAVKSNSGVSSSQFTINGSSFGAEVSVTVKFNSKRAGCSAKLYRYNSSANTLSLVSRSAVQSNGQCKFDDVKQGGEYIVVLS